MILGIIIIAGLYVFFGLGSYRQMAGVVVSADGARMQIRFLHDNEGYTIPVTDKTHIMATESRKLSDGALGYITREINVSELPAGALISVRYGYRKGYSLYNVARVDVVNEDTIPPYQDTFEYIEGIVKGFDPQTQKLTFVPASVLTQNEISLLVTNLPIYTVSDVGRKHVIHARKVGNVTDFVPEARFILVHRRGANGKITPSGFIIEKI